MRRIKREEKSLSLEALSLQALVELLEDLIIQFSKAMLQQKFLKENLNEKDLSLQQNSFQETMKKKIRKKKIMLFLKV